ncbi:hypothetical protein BHE74_00051172, partial [Ensete ventricosum]
MVFGRETSDHNPRDDVEGKPLHRCRNSDRRKARGAEASPNETTPGIHLGIVEEEDRGTRLQQLTTPDDSSQLHADRDFPPNKGQGLLAPPNCIKTQPEERDKGRYYRFQHEYGHDTEECRDLKNQIEDLIRQGHLGHYVQRRGDHPDRRSERDRQTCPADPVEQRIDVIVGGPTAGGDSTSARKAYARAA